MTEKFAAEFPVSWGVRVGHGMAVLILGVVGLACQQAQTASLPPAPPPPPVTVTRVEKVAVTDANEYIGRTVSVSSVDLRARVTGFLEKQTFEEGGVVQEGQLLYLIEQAPYRAAVEAAEAAVAQTEAALQNAEKYLDRLNTVRDVGGASKAGLDAAEGQMMETRALLAQRKAQLSQATLNLGYTEIRAPTSGTIGRTAIHVGNLAGPESGVLSTIVQLDPIWVTFPITEREYLALQQEPGPGNGRPIPELVPTIRLVDGSTFPHEGRLDFQDNQVDETTGTIMLRATFPNPRQLLRPGQFVTVIQSRREAAEQLVVPQAAVQRDQVGAFVMVVDQSNRAGVRRVRLGRVIGPSWIVTEGLAEGESIISEGLQSVTDGAEVIPEPDPARSFKRDGQGAE